MHFVTAGESHGAGLVALVSDVPNGVPLTVEQIDHELLRRSRGYGRSARQSLEADCVEVLSGVRFGHTLGTPIALLIRNWDFREDMDARVNNRPDTCKPVTCPRAGHADLAGAHKLATTDCQAISERASARETAARVAAGAVAKAFLSCVGVEVFSSVTQIGPVVCTEDVSTWAGDRPFYEMVESSPVRCADAQLSQEMCAAIDAAAEANDTLGGSFEVRVTGLLPGIGGFADPTQRLTALLGAALFSIPAIRSVSFGDGASCASSYGSNFLDAIESAREGGYTRVGNKSGGLEGGMTTGLDLVIHANMKPIPTRPVPTSTIDLATMTPALTTPIRADVCAVPAAAVIAEAEVAFVLARAYLEKFGRDTLADILAALASYRTRIGL